MGPRSTSNRHWGSEPRRACNRHRRSGLRSTNHRSERMRPRLASKSSRRMGLRVIRNWRWNWNWRSGPWWKSNFHWGTGLSRDSMFLACQVFQVIGFQCLGKPFPKLAEHSGLICTTPLLSKFPKVPSDLEFTLELGILLHLSTYAHYLIL